MDNRHWWTCAVQLVMHLWSIGGEDSPVVRAASGRARASHWLSNSPGRIAEERDAASRARRRPQLRHEAGRTVARRTTQVTHGSRSESKPQETRVAFRGRLLHYTV